MSGSNTVSRICLYLILRYILKDNGDRVHWGALQLNVLIYYCCSTAFHFHLRYSLHQHPRLIWGPPSINGQQPQLLTLFEMHAISITIHYPVLNDGHSFHCTVMCVPMRQISQCTMDQIKFIMSFIWFLYKKY